MRVGENKNATKLSFTDDRRHASQTLYVATSLSHTVSFVR